MKGGDPILNKARSLDDFGTLGGFVMDLDTKEVLGITAYHAVWRHGLPWRSFSAKEIGNEELLKVSTLNETGKQKIDIGSISRTHFDSKIDIALIKFNDRFENNLVFESAEACLFSELSTNDWVKKRGAKTTITHSQFASFHEDKMSLAFTSKIHAFKWLMRFSRGVDLAFSDPGDSGSIIYKGNRVAGVLLGGDDTYTYGMHAFYIENKLNITF